MPVDAEQEMQIVSRRVADLGWALELPELPSTYGKQMQRVVTVFRELCAGVTEGGIRMP